VVLLTHAVQAPGLYTSSGYELVGQVDDYPAGSAAYWFRKRLDGQPSPRVKRWVQAVLWAGVVLLLVAELIDDVKISHRRITHVASSWWARLERRERRHTRRSEIAVLASRLGRPRPRRQP
jgi:hypothetical protein